MAQFHSPVKLCPSSPKRSRNEVNWDNCIIWQSSFCDSLVITMRNISKTSFIEALEARKDDVYVRILQDVSSLNCIRCEDFKMLYHHGCYNHKQAGEMVVILCQNPLQYTYYMYNRIICARF